MKRFLAFIGVFLAVIVQTSLLPHFSIRGFLPSVRLIIVFCWSLLGDYKEAIFWAVGGGVLLDLFSSLNFSIAMLSLLLVVLVLYLLTNTVFSFDKYYSRLWLAGLTSLFYYGITFAFSWLFYFIRFSGTKIDLSISVLWPILFGTVLNTLAILVVFPLIARYQKVIDEFTARLENKP